MEHPAVAEAAVVAAPDPVWQERPVAFVVPAGGPPPDEAALNAHVAVRFARWQVPDRIVVVDALPRGATGKTDKAALRRLL